jgi:hypothetical protein
MNARSPLPPLAIALLLSVLAPRAAACELDGLSHGYGPMGAMFAGAHRYQSLNGLADEAEERAAVESTPVDATPAKPATPATPRRSFAAWAKRKTSAAASDEAPARWTAPASAAAAPSAAMPPVAEPSAARQR